MPPEAEAKCEISVQFFNAFRYKIKDLMSRPIEAEFGQYVLETHNSKQNSEDSMWGFEPP